MKHNSRDLLVDSNGTVRHTVIISAAVNCEVNLFNYPFAADECPVAIQTWTKDGEQGRGKNISTGIISVSIHLKKKSAMFVFLFRGHSLG